MSAGLRQPDLQPHASRGQLRRSSACSHPGVDARGVRPDSVWRPRHAGTPQSVAWPARSSRRDGGAGGRPDRQSVGALPARTRPPSGVVPYPGRQRRMSAALAPSWPGSRVLLGWWRELIGRQPQQLWFSRLLLHRVESLVRVTHTRSLDLWQRALLRLVHARIPRGPDPENYFADLQIDGQVLSQLIHQLTAAGLLHMNGAGTWDVTTAGRHALE